MVYQVITIFAVTVVYCLIIFLFCRRFISDITMPLILSMPIVAFSIGFILRLSKQTSTIDIGYFLTDSSTIMPYMLITGALILGQLRFWRK
ncbi:hypothetical protein A3B02_00670 [Candidatus Roizmanbacteria bacterium RIFCSPLOWO2_01_FULL_42_14]|uniref:Uncharacterized protein n=3 Tax=Candidatus Roizmaniibacteriota TaxID=1752723 RepID=A0A1F7K1W7_9BACT|nr:MAG: hypothetical protein A3F32_01045 [Candidatus Roizmanbacteria bacterium RIFCSPHIGHO2_12_FULL_42_10]OGK51634.1 MAG: hypothetical protein A3B02_00670 [Candidatus Roizmanbacteria bacterium RIFCSPLOWO2_01_FULL_42_14]OGK61815.1 MAG: hypothetical protein A3I56_04175 [Candidatus Roizmanbacteria bacterium RIFCSPLOWO2_02_FULL_43_10]